LVALSLGKFVITGLTNNGGFSLIIIFREITCVGRGFNFTAA
jgi:hypothetical protein